MKKLIKNKKLLFGIIIGLILGVSITGVVAYSVYANKVTYDNTQSGLQSTNVQDALDELYTKANAQGIDSNSIDFATLQTNTTKKVLASSKGICINRNNKLNCFKINNYAEEQNHIQQVFSDVSCNVGSYYVGCSASDFTCDVQSDGFVRCFDTYASSSCNVDRGGTVRCN